MENKITFVDERTKQYRCSKGHEWSEVSYGAFNTLIFKDIPGIPETPLCIHCAAEFAHQYFGTVSEVTADPDAVVEGP